ncbi:hypothetical protein N7530_013008 [Penicillium desertorum]|uniref:Uncharacterized protein n=1 Tax=Penicillium desertorum TaxID=1303715 RepID=A0A9W9WD20_9EURO|nr:hypothetical protein N7530_013008 [Penicillium desertorum]
MCLVVLATTYAPPSPPPRPHHRPAPSPTPHCRGLAPGGPPTKAPGPWPPGGGPLRPPSPPSRSANWRTRKIAISSARRGGPSPRPPSEAAPPKPPPPLRRKVPPVRAPRASRLARRLRLPSTSPALHPARLCGQLPRRANWRPHAPPSQGREAPPAAPRPGLGEGTAGGAWLHGDRRAGGSYREGHPARAPTVRSPAMPASLTRRNAATLADPHSLSPGPTGPGPFVTDSPTPLGGVKPKMQ